MIYTCKKCNYQFEVNIMPHPHNSFIKLSSCPTCAKAAAMSKVCPKCGSAELNMSLDIKK